MKSLSFIFGLSLLSAQWSFANEVDCSEAYGKPSQCVKIACAEKYQSFLGTWEGPFKAFDQEIGEFRPYANKVTYSEQDCLKNIETGDEFIIGRRTDVYPAYKGLQEKREEGLLITGKKNGHSDQPFLRTVSYICKGVVERIDDYTLVFKNVPTDTSVWQLNFPASNGSPARTVQCKGGKTINLPATQANSDMLFTTIDGRDMTAPEGVHKRLVSVTLAVPGWEGVVVIGYHSKPEAKK